MALNPPLSGYQPCPVAGEYFVLRRDGMEAEIKIGRNKYTGKGEIFLTTVRLVFVNKKSSSFKAFDIPLSFMYQEQFKQPIFGANYIQGSVKPLYNLIPEDAHFKLWFMQGGVSTFLRLFYNVTSQIRQRKHNGPDPNFVRQLSSGKLQNVAFVDPNDPSVIFLQQPSQSSPEALQNWQAQNVQSYCPPPPTQVQTIDMRNPQNNQFSNTIPSGMAPIAYNQPPPTGMAPIAYNQLPPTGMAPIAYNQPPPTGMAPIAYNQPPPTGMAPIAYNQPPPAGMAPIAYNQLPPAGMAPMYQNSQVQPGQIVKEEQKQSLNYNPDYYVPQQLPGPSQQQQYPQYQGDYSQPQMLPQQQNFQQQPQSFGFSQAPNYQGQYNYQPAPNILPPPGQKQ